MSEGAQGDSKSCIENKAERTTVFYLLRHGECEGGDILRGIQMSP
ncbi:hypothetical protein [Shewanella psychropiezotolerans]|nr:hypothetical protein [Shewanella psychropiezotolerans]